MIYRLKYEASQRILTKAFAELIEVRAALKESEAKISAVVEDLKSDMEYRYDCLEHHTEGCEVEGCEDPDECSLCLTKQRIEALENKS